MARGLDGLSVMITGAGAGIGRQLALDLHQNEGVRLILLDRDLDAMERLQGDLRDGVPAGAGAVQIHRCDVGSTASIEKVMRTLEGVPVDVLVNNAGVLYAGPFESMPIEDFENVININLLGAVRLTRLVLPWLLKSSNATVVNVASLAGLVASPGMCAYSTSKFGLVGFSEALKSELRGRVHVCTICPSLVKTDLARNAKVDGDADSDVRNRQVEWMDAVMEKLGAEPVKVSNAIIRAIKTRQDLVLVNPDAHFFYYLKRVLPQASERLAYSLYRRLAGPGPVTGNVTR